MTITDEGTIFAPSLAPTGVHNDSDFEAVIRKSTINQKRISSR